VATILINFSKNKLTRLAYFVQFKRMLMFCLEDWGPVRPSPPPSAPSLHALKAEIVCKATELNWTKAQ